MYFIRHLGVAWVLSVCACSVSLGQVTGVPLGALGPIPEPSRDREKQKALIRAQMRQELQASRPRPLICLEAEGIDADASNFENVLQPDALAQLATCRQTPTQGVIVAPLAPDLMPPGDPAPYALRTIVFFDAYGKAKCRLSSIWTAMVADDGQGFDYLLFVRNLIYKIQLRCSSFRFPFGHLRVFRNGEPLDANGSPSSGDATYFPLEQADGCPMWVLRPEIEIIRP